MDKLMVSPSPHIYSGNSTRKIMLDVIIALLPASVMSIVYFGYNAALLIAVCVATAVFSEWACRRIMKRESTVCDLSAIVTGLLVALGLPSTLPLWMAMIGSAVAIVVVKQMFGGIGQNFANPAIVGRIVLMMSFTAAMTDWVEPFSRLSGSADAVTTATPLASTYDGGATYIDMLLGKTGGSLGETCAIALIAGGVWLVCRRVITPTIPLVFIGTTAAVLYLCGADPIKGILSGGLLIGAIFMATDYVTSPTTEWGKVIFAFGCGLITAIIRVYGSLPEGVSFAILLMNILTPHIDRLVMTRPFGTVKAKKEAQ